MSPLPLATNVIESAFGPLIKAFEVVLVFIHEHLIGGSWGWAILGLTVAVRLVLFPLFVRQMKSIVALQRHLPEMRAIQERYKDDRQKQSEELMKFYRENNINPFASCLPLLLQLPVLISLFYMLRTDLKKHICGPQLVSHYNQLHHTALQAVSHLPNKYIEHTTCAKVAPHTAGFLFLPDLTNHASGAALVLLILLYAASMLAASLISSAAADRSQRLMAIFLPLVFTFIVVGLPTGLLVYWIATNLWTIGQGLVIRKRMPHLSPAAARAAAAQATANGSAPAPAAIAPAPRRRRRKRSGRRR